jgi:hypothetical protein
MKRRRDPDRGGVAFMAVTLKDATNTESAVRARASMRERVRGMPQGHTVALVMICVTMMEGSA